MFDPQGLASAKNREQWSARKKEKARQKDKADYKKQVPSQSQRDRHREMADLAGAVYDEDRGVASNKIPEGWNAVPKEKLEGLGLDPASFQNDDNGFAAGLYQHEDGSFALAFRGTQPLDFRVSGDWSNNLTQGLGVSAAQYEQAISLAQNVVDSVDSNVMMTGHSLGGGLASAAALSTNSEGVTFNAAGLHKNSIGTTNEQRNQLGSQLVSGYYVKGEALNQLQSSYTNFKAIPYVAPEATGNKIGLRAVNPSIFLPGRVTNHGMPAVKEAMDRVRR